MKQRKSFIDSYWFYASLIMPWVTLLVFITLHELEVIDVLKINIALQIGIILGTGAIPLIVLLTGRR